MKTEEIKTKTVSEIEAQIRQLQESVEQKKEQIKEYQKRRAEVVINGDNTTKNKARVTSIDAEMKKLDRAIDNAPHELKLLGDQLDAERDRIAQEENDELLDKQQEIANEVELLSRNFIGILEKAIDVNRQLLAVISVESGIRQQTGADVLGDYCHGSQGSLFMLQELMTSQMSGTHTTPFGDASTNARIRL